MSAFLFIASTTNYVKWSWSMESFQLIWWSMDWNELRTNILSHTYQTYDKKWGDKKFRNFQTGNLASYFSCKFYYQLQVQAMIVFCPNKCQQKWDKKLRNFYNFFAHKVRSLVFLLVINNSCFYCSDTFAPITCFLHCHLS